MFDLHCHLLPGIDDGPATMEQAIELARLAVSNGITHSVVTPHIHAGRWENELDTIQPVFERFKLALSEQNIPLQLGMASEVRIGAEILSMIPDRRIPMLGHYDGRQVMLLELPHSHIPPGTDKIIAWLLKQNILPMIAHPERNKDIIRKLNKIDPLVKLGCLFQVTAGSVMGNFGDKAEKRARQLLEMGVVTILATDAHNSTKRPPDLRGGRDAAAAIVGLEEANRMTHQTPMTILGL